MTAQRRVVERRATEQGRVGLGPRAFVIWSLSALTVSVVTENPIYRLLVALAALAVLQTWLPPGRSLRRVGYAALFAAAVALVLNVALGHTGVHVLAELPAEWPVIGGPITAEAAVYGLAIGLGLVAALLAVAPLSLVLEPHDIVDAMPRPLSRTGIAVAASLNLVGGIGRTFGEVRDAQQMRGWRPRGLRSWNEVIVPVVLTSIEDSVLLAESMEARGFGAGMRTSYAESRWTAADLVVVATALGAAAVFVVARAAAVVPQWYPYPALEMPPANPILVLCCLGLAVPALLRREGEASGPDAREASVRWR